ncbi:MAG: hydantoinase/oxoprolinase family protein, partial [Rhodospirillaceae bacterium]|nr:hydantoinase/oxoprolinase family protein [Rhodospirillaceae bacterium]
MSYRLGVDVGGTFTDLLLINEADSSFHIAKVPSTPADPSIGVLNGTDKVCELAGIAPGQIEHVMHGSTIATNAILTGKGARVGLVTTEGYRHVLQIARSFVPGGLGAWVIFNKTPPLAPLKLTIEARERIGANGEIVTPLNEDALRQSLRHLKRKGIDALTISLFNSYTNDAHERLAGRIAEEELPDVPVSLSCDVIPEMQEYERTITTVCNSYVRPIVAKYVRNLSDELERRSKGVKLHILRSDGGLTPPAGAETVPVNLLMSGPAGGVAGALWIARQAGFENLLTFDMGGTSTDVCLIRDGLAQTRRDTTVGDLTVRASSLDVRSVGAGGGSIAHVPMTGALRVGPESAGADPGP